MPITAATVLSILDAARRPVFSDAEWSRGVLESLQGLWPSAIGGTTFFLDMSRDGRFENWMFQGAGALGAKRGDRMFGEWDTSTPVVLKRHAYQRRTCGVQSQMPVPPDLRPSLTRAAQVIGVPDMLGLPLPDETGRGVSFTLALPEEQRQPLDPDFIQIVDRIGLHILAALRARRGEPALEIPLRGAPLSGRERVIVERVRLGQSNKLIAFELGLTVSTVSTLLMRAMRKLGAPSRLALIRDGAPAELPAELAHVLTPTELTVARLALAGHSNRAIAKARQRSELTIAKQLERIYRKLGIASRVELATWRRPS